MIVNIQKYRSSGTKTIIFGTLVVISSIACKTPFWSTDGDEDDRSGQQPIGDWLDQSSRSAILSLTAEDYQGLSSRGSPIQWHPILMPLRNELSLADRDFVLGTPNSLGAIEGTIPEAGQCLLLNISSTPIPLNNASIPSLTNVSMELRDAFGQTQIGARGQLFFIHDQATRAVRAIGFFDEQGQAQCQIPQGRWFVSTGFGEARGHKIFSTTAGKDVRVQIRHHQRARITIRAGKDTGIQVGDLMRIGRLTASQAAAQEADQLPEVPLQVQEDLFRPVLTPSENLGVREYLFTSLIIQRREFSIQLDPGEYTIGLWRNGGMYRCAGRLIVNSKEDSLLACDPGMVTARLSEKNQPVNELSNSSSSAMTSLVFDGSFMPSRLIGQSSFRAWMAKSGVSRILRAGRTVDTQQQQIQFLLQPLMQDFSATTIQRPEGPYVGDFRLTQRSDTDEKMGRANFARLLIAQSGMNIDSVLARVFDSSHFSQTIPIAGTSERGLLEGVVPLTFRTVLKSSGSRSFRTEGAETLATNGSLIEWLEPLPAASGAPLKLGPQQHIRMRLLVPPEDTTENFGMFINGERFKQWSVNRNQSKSSYRSIEIDEKINMQSDFFVAFASWGQNYLPEFMYGVRQLPALAFTRIYCVDINENAICDRQ